MEMTNPDSTVETVETVSMPATFKPIMVRRKKP